MPEIRNDHDRLCQGREYTCTCGYDAERDADHAAKDLALGKINAIRNSIIGCQTMNWSEHIYPLVAALEEAGIKGMGYPAARANVGTLIERAASAEGALAAKDAEIKRLRDSLEKIADPKSLSSFGDPSVLRDAARDALNGGSDAP